MAVHTNKKSVKRKIYSLHIKQAQLPCKYIVHSYPSSNSKYIRNSLSPSGDDNCHMRTELIASERNWGIGGLWMASHSGSLWLWSYSWLQKVSLNGTVSCSIDPKDNVYVFRFFRMSYKEFKWLFYSVIFQAWSLVWNTFLKWNFM